MGLSIDGRRGQAYALLTRWVLGILLGATASSLGAAPADASCNFIPGAENVFRASISSIDRPFGAPGFPVVVGLDLAGCDMELGAGFVDQDASGIADDDFDVVLLFTPPAGPSSAVILRDDADATACDGFDGSALQTACAAELPVLGPDPTAPTQAVCRLASIDVIDNATLQFVFPDTSDLIGASAIGSGATLAGPGKVAIVPRSETELPCELAQPALTCSDASPATAPLLSCVDDFFDINGSCSLAQTPQNVLEAFPGFTALPLWNDYEAMCTTPDSSCDGLEPTARFTIDRDGNMLVPVNWGGVLLRLDDGTPVPRLINVTTGLPAFDGAAGAIRVPGESFTNSLSPEGHFLPPILSPFNEVEGGEPVVFGSVDAPFSVIRVSRRGEQLEWCVGGAFDGEACNDDEECGAGGLCQQSVCHAAATPGARPMPVDDGAGPVACSSDAECAAAIPGSECGPSLFDFSTRFSGEGCGPGLVDAAIYSADVAGSTPLESLFSQSSDEILAIVRSEPIEALTAVTGGTTSGLPPVVGDLNGDQDADDITVTMLNRETGAEQRIGIGVSSAIAVATDQVFQGSFVTTAVVTEDDILALAQSDPMDFRTDWDGNGRIQDSSLRIFRLAPNDDVSNPPLNPAMAIDLSADIDGQPFGIEDGLVFAISRESDLGARATRPTSTSELTDQTPTSFASAENGLTFAVADNFDGPLGVGTHFHSNNSDGGISGVRGVAEVGGFFGSEEVRGISEFDIRGLDFAAADAATLTFDVFREDGLFDQGGGPFLVDLSAYFGNNREDLSDYQTPASPIASFSTDGLTVGSRLSFDVSAELLGALLAEEEALAVRLQQQTTNREGPAFTFDNFRLSSTAVGESTQLAISSDSRFVLFATNADSLDFGPFAEDEVSVDTNGQRDVYLRDRDSDGDGIFDELGAIELELISVATDDTQGDEPSGFGGADVAEGARYVVFTSASDLDAQRPTGTTAQQVFLRDRGDGEVGPITTRISVGPCDPGAFGEAAYPVFSNDGKTIAFQVSREESLPLICTYEVETSVLEVAISAAEKPALSYDASQLAFLSFEDLARKDRDERVDAYVLDRTKRKVELVSPGTDDGDVFGVSISDDGWTVAIATDANVDPDDLFRSFGENSDPYVYDRRTESLRFIDLGTVFGTDPLEFPVGFTPNDLGVHADRIAIDPKGHFLVSITAEEFDVEEGFFPSFALVTNLATQVTRWGSFDDGLAARPVDPVATMRAGIATGALDVAFASDQAFASNDLNSVIDTHTSGADTNPVEGFEEGDRNFDDDLSDEFLYVFDTRDPEPSFDRLGPAHQVSLDEEGSASFLCPEGANRQSPADGNGDFDSQDLNVCFWESRGEGVENLGQDAVEIDSSTSFLAARVKDVVAEAASVAVYSLESRLSDAWTDVEDAAGDVQTADSLCGVTGDDVAFTTLERVQGVDFNGDGDLHDRFAQFYDAANDVLSEQRAGVEFCEVGPAAGICVSGPGPACDVDDDCPGTEYCDAEIGSCRSFGNVCDTGADCAPGEICRTGALVGFATNEAKQCNADLLCLNASSFGCSCDIESDDRSGLAQCDFMAYCEALPQLGCSECDLNGDGDCCDDVLQAYDTATDRLVNCAQAVVPCNEAACDPRDSVLVRESTITFLTQECDQGTGDTIESSACVMDGNGEETADGGDLNANGQTAELIVQTCNGRTAEVFVEGTFDPASGGDPFSGDVGGGTAFMGSGVCVQRFEAESCLDPAIAGTSSDDCALDRYCDVFGTLPTVCAQDFGACNSDADCPVGVDGTTVECRPQSILVASDDRDQDTISDAFDNCETTPNSSQNDLDRDGIGDACDVATCGNGVLEEMEACDDGNTEDGDSCSSTCEVTALLCDANGDAHIDEIDITAITATIGTPVGPGDPRDFNGNGIIDLFDSTGCTTQCTRENCQRRRMCGLVGFELVLVAIPVLRRRLRGRSRGTR